MTAFATGLRGWKPSVDSYEYVVVLLEFSFEDFDESTPRYVGSAFSEPQRFFHGGHVQVLYRDDVVLPCDSNGDLVDEVVSCMLGSRIQSCDLDQLLRVVVRILLHMGQLSLFSGNLPFVLAELPLEADDSAFEFVLGLRAVGRDEHPCKRHVEAYVFENVDVSGLEELLEVR